MNLLYAFSSGCLSVPINSKCYRMRSRDEKYLDEVSETHRVLGLIERSDANAHRSERSICGFITDKQDTEFVLQLDVLQMSSFAEWLFNSIFLRRQIIKLIEKDGRNVKEIQEQKTIHQHSCILLVLVGSWLRCFPL